MEISTLIMLVTIITSVMAFQNTSLFSKLEFSPYLTTFYKQYYRLVSHALIHGDWMHLGFNMFVLWMFGSGIEQDLMGLFGSKGLVYFVVLYAGGAAFSNLAALKKHKNNPNYRAVGASGAISSLLFAFIIINPLSRLNLLILPLPNGFPAFLFGGFYLWLEYYLSKKDQGRIAHDAHFWGAVFGVVFMVVLKFELLISFFQEVLYCLMHAKDCILG